MNTNEINISTLLKRLPPALPLANWGITIISVVFLASLLFISCVTCPPPKPCPPADVIFPVETEMGVIPGAMPQGFFDKGEGERWLTLKDFNERRRKK